MRYLCLLLTCFLLAACAPVASVKAPSIEEDGMSPQMLRAELSKIPGAQIAEGSLLVSFPVGTLFAAGSALPMPGGIEPLDALSTLMKQSGLSWSLIVRAASGEGELYDSELAATRAKILKTYFKSTGLNLQKVSIMARAESGAPLELKPIQ